MNQSIVLITGGSSGIGAATARILAQAGMTVYAASRRGTSEASDTPGVVPVRLDVNDEAATRALVEQIVAKEGRLDAVVVNAGNGIAGALEETSDEELRYQAETCLFGANKTIRACLPVFRRQHSGRIVTVTSVAAIVPLPFQGAYSGIKSAMLAMTEALAMELRGSGIQCGSVLPGDTATGFTGARRYTEASQRPDSPYREACDRNRAKIEKDETGGMSPDVIGKAILRQLTRRKMTPRMTPRIDYKAVGALVRLVPTRTKLRILHFLYN